MSGHADRLPDLLASLSDRMARFAESLDPSQILNPAVMDEVRQLVELAQPQGGDWQSLPAEVLAILGDLHAALYQVLPEGEDQDHLRVAAVIFSFLLARAPDQIPDRLRALLGEDQPETASEVERQNTEGTRALGAYQQTGSAEVLDTAVAAFRAALAAAPPGGPDLAGLQSNLGSALLTRFERTGDSADLDAGISALEEAVALEPPGQPDLAIYLANLGNGLQRRFERTGASADLDAAIRAGRQAIGLAPPGDTNLSKLHSNLGAMLMRRFEHTGDSTDLDTAIRALQEAIALAPPGLSLVACQSNLGGALQRRFEHAGDGADIDAAISVLRAAVGLSPPGHPRLAEHQSNLGTALQRRFERGGDSTDIDAAVSAGHEAVALTPPDHPSLAVYLSNLGNSLRTRYERGGDSEDIDAAIDCWQWASQMPAGKPSTRLAAAAMWGTAAAGAGRVHEAAQGYAAAVGLLPMVAWHGLDRTARQDILAQRAAGLATSAAAYAILDNQPRRAVELLEQGRSVLWAQALNLRSDLARLAGQHPSLAARLDSIRSILDAPIPQPARPVPSAPVPGASAAAPADRVIEQQDAGDAEHAGDAGDAADLRRRMAREWDETVVQVRALDGFEHFLAAVPYAELAPAAAGGPVIIVNVSSHGCHALIVDAASDQPRVVSLPDLTRDAAGHHAAEMLVATAAAGDPDRTAADRDQDQDAMRDMLEWLWDVVAEPVLTTLGYAGPPPAADRWPRVWWSLTGPLSLLPVHAAGRQPCDPATATDSAECVPARVISSYTPTLTALVRARQHAAPAQVRHLTVAMAAAPGLPPLPAVAAEVRILQRHFPVGQDNQQLAGPQATRAAVLAAEASCSWVHLACHASQHSDPDRGGFALSDGTLTVTDLIGQPSQHRDLAFLSACQTAAGSIRHLDEAIHLAAALQFLGYRQVIATLWPVADLAALRVADNFYTMLASNGQDADRAAEALHHAIRALRQFYPARPEIWAAYVHVGA